MTRVSIPYAEISVPYFYDAMSGTPTHEVQKGLFASLSSSGTLLYPSRLTITHEVIGIVRCKTLFREYIEVQLLSLLTDRIDTVFFKNKMIVKT